ncbi:ParB/RepB/Spo0J family partition protein, partial [Kitasatospora sp. HPMI-4]|uniref:ParB/RepB/Spo0J family partition protein n=1 Tax=Kitasatospora sp. HPMI-4 TaxID=3448443 RepID=UPI003F1C57C5
MKVHDSQGQVAKRLGKTPAWVSQRLALLELTPELQEKVETGELKVEPARRIGRLPKEQQASAAAETINAVNTLRRRSPRREPSTEQPAPTVNAVNTSPAGPQPEGPLGSTVNAVNTPAEPEAPATQQIVIPLAS